MNSRNQAKLMMQGLDYVLLIMCDTNPRMHVLPKLLKIKLRVDDETWI